MTILAAGGGVVACVATRVATRVAGPPANQVVGDATSILVDDFEHAADELTAVGWQHEALKGTETTRYSLRRESGNRHLHGEADGGGSLLTRSVDCDPRDVRYLSFRCRVTSLPRKANLRQRDGDDCGLRLFVTFAYESERASLGEKLARSLAGRELPGTSLCYVWTDGVEVGSILPNPFTDRTQMLVIQNGHSALGKWVTVERDILADYQTAFGRNPPRITGVAIMVDSDQTKSRAVADLDDLELRRIR